MAYSESPDEKALLKAAIDRDPIGAAKQFNYEVTQLSPKDVVDKADYEKGYRFRILKPVPGQPYPEVILARSEGEIAAFLKREIAGNPDGEEAPSGEELKRRLGHLAGEVEHLRHDFGIDLEEIRSHIAALTAKLEERISPEEVAEVGRMVTDMRLFLSGLMLPWRKEITGAREERDLWKRRIERGECELVNEIQGKYALYKSWHHLPSCDTWVETLPL